jgi:hypothetical protein
MSVIEPSFIIFGDSEKLKLPMSIRRFSAWPYNEKHNNKGINPYFFIRQSFSIPAISQCIILPHFIEEIPICLYFLSLRDWRAAGDTPSTEQGRISILIKTGKTPTLSGEAPVHIKEEKP